MDSEEESTNYYFIASSFNCGKVESSNITINRITPDFTDLKWELVSYDEENNETGREEVTEIEHGLTATLSASVENIEDGKNLYIKVYEEGYTSPDDYIQGTC